MKSRFVLMAIGLCIAFGVALADSPAETSWFDFQNCDMCKNMAAQPGLIDHMHFESFVIGTGTMNVCTVDPEFAAAYGTAMKAMQAKGEEMIAGKPMTLCGCCQDIGKLMMAGAKMENVDTQAGHVMLLTSTDPALIKQLQAHGQRSIDEMATMMSEAPAASGHEGDGH